MQSLRSRYQSEFIAISVIESVTRVIYVRSLVLFIILNPNGSQSSMNLSTFHSEKMHHDWRGTMPSIRVTCPHRQERKRERESLGIVWVMTNRFRGPAHPSRPLLSPLDTNRSCRGHVRARVEDIVSIDRSLSGSCRFFSTVHL